MSTIRDVAARAGVSITTVSRYLRGEHIQSADAVSQACSDLDYTPAPAARTLRSGRHNAVGVIVPDITNPFFASAVRGIESVCRAASYSLVLYHTDEDSELEAQVLREVRRQTDGLIIAPADGHPGYPSSIDPRRVPVVLLDREIEGVSLDCVLVDNEGGGRQAATYLLSLGHTRIGEISGPLHTTPGEARHQGFIKTLADGGVEDPEAYHLEGDFREEGGYQAMLRLLALPRPPTAVFSANNLQTIGALKALRDMGVRVPEEMSIIGFDDLDLASLLSPALTVIDRPTAEQGALAARLLLAGLHGARRRQPQRIVLNTRLVVRDSCATPQTNGISPRWSAANPLPTG